MCAYICMYTVCVCIHTHTYRRTTVQTRFVYYDPLLSCRGDGGATNCHHHWVVYSDLESTPQEHTRLHHCQPPNPESWPPPVGVRQLFVTGSLFVDSVVSSESCGRSTPQKLTFARAAAQTHICLSVRPWPLSFSASLALSPALRTEPWQLRIFLFLCFPCVSEAQERWMRRGPVTSSGDNHAALSSPLQRASRPRNFFLTGSGVARTFTMSLISE